MIKLYLMLIIICSSCASHITYDQEVVIKQIAIQKNTSASEYRLTVFEYKTAGKYLLENINSEDNTYQLKEIYGNEVEIINNENFAPKEFNSMDDLKKFLATQLPQRNYGVHFNIIEIKKISENQARGSGHGGIVLGMLWHLVSTVTIGIIPVVSNFNESYLVERTELRNKQTKTEEFTNSGQYWVSIYSWFQTPHWIFYSREKWQEYHKRKYYRLLFET